MEAYANAMSRYFDYSGRSSRSQFWLYALILAAMYISATILGELIGIGWRPFLAILNIAHIFPNTSVAIRRLHDSDRSGWWILLPLIPIVGSIIFIVFLCFAPSAGSNRFGPNPLAKDRPSILPQPPASQSNVDVIPQLEKLANLWASGAIDDDEYQRMKTNLVQRQLS